jgi:hypothetical protein
VFPIQGRDDVAQIDDSLGFVAVGFRVWRTSDAETEEQSRRERNHIAAGPSTPVLEDEAAEEFLETIEKNRIRKVSKPSFDRAQKAYKNFTKPDNGN